MTIQDQLRSDPELYQAYKANIAMFVYDAITYAIKRKKAHLNVKSVQLTQEERVMACNEGADNFLKELIK